MGIRAVILCAGYGTRFQKDLESDVSESFNHLIGIPKPLLPINSKPLILYWIDIFDNITCITEIIIVSNETHKNLYHNLLKDLKDIRKSIKIVSDGSLNNQDRSGAVACMQLGVKNCCQDDAFFVAGDTLFDPNFKLEEMIQTFLKLKNDDFKVCLLVSAPVREEDVFKHGIIEVCEKGLVKKFLEKPQVHETSSRLQSPCCYLLSQSSFAVIDEFLHLMEGQPLSKKDATGNLIKYLVTKIPTFTYHVPKRYDIGNLASYVECCQKF